ncbi:hypothetical protein [Rhodococcoides corynebacterioides]|nr:hypothetical protein [Rhodococcus corynebacterioides]
MRSLLWLGIHGQVSLYWPSHSATGVYSTVDLRTYGLMWMTSR